MAEKQPRSTGRTQTRSTTTPINPPEDVYCVQLLSAVAQSSAKDGWQLELLNVELCPCNTVEDFNMFVDKAYFNLKANSELVLFIRISVTEDNCLVVGNKGVPEREFLNTVIEKYKNPNSDSMFNLERHIIFLTSKYSEKMEIFNNKGSNKDSIMMKGVTLYRIDIESNREIKPDLLVKKIKNAADKYVSQRPLSALSFCRELNKELGHKDTDMQVVMVPSGKEPVQSPGNELDPTVDIVLYLLVDRGFICEEVNADKQCIVAFSETLKNVPRCISLGEKFSHSESGQVGIRLDLNKTNLVNEVRRIAQQISKEELKLGNIWLFVMAHGNNQGIMLTESEFIGIEELTIPLFESSLKDADKVFVISCCRGELPMNGSGNACVKKEQKKKETDVDKETFGLMFQNSSGMKDPWSVSSLKKCVTIYGSVPEFKAYRPPHEMDEFLDVAKMVVTSVPNDLRKSYQLEGETLSDLKELESKPAEYRKKNEDLDRKSVELAAQYDKEIKETIRKIHHQLKFRKILSECSNVAENIEKTLNSGVPKEDVTAYRPSHEMNQFLDAAEVVFTSVSNDLRKSYQLEGETLSDLKDLKRKLAEYREKDSNFRRESVELAAQYEKEIKETMRKISDQPKFRKILSECSNVAENIEKAGSCSVFRPPYLFQAMEMALKELQKTRKPNESNNKVDMLHFIQKIQSKMNELQEQWIIKMTSSRDALPNIDYLKRDQKPSQDERGGTQRRTEDDDSKSIKRLQTQASSNSLTATVEPKSPKNS